MKKSILIHAIWAVITVISFVVGARHFPSVSDVDSSEDSYSGDHRGARSASRGSDDSANNPRRSRSASRSKQRDGSLDASRLGSINLSEQGIKSLGNIIKTSNDPIERRIAFAKLLEGLTAENAEMMREQILHMPHNSPEWREFHYSWGALTGDIAVTFGEESKQKDLASAFSGWASASPQAAINWFNNLTSDKQKGNGLKWSAVYGLSNGDPQFATDFVIQRLQAGDKDAGRMMELVAKAVLKAGNPVEAARWSEHLPEGPLRDVAVSRVARDYANENPTKAIAWLESLPQSDGKSKGLREVFSTWATTDADAAGEKLNQMGDSPARDSAVNGYARRLVYSDPQLALDWANSISDPKARTDAIVRNGRIYFRRDRDAARQWLESSSLSPELQERIIGSGRRR